MVGFYARKHHRYEDNLLKKKLKGVLEDYSCGKDDSSSHKDNQMALVYAALYGNDHPTSNTFLPPGWTDISFSIEAKL